MSAWNASLLHQLLLWKWTSVSSLANIEPPFIVGGALIDIDRSAVYSIL